ncbi:MAG: bleomycin resistance protein [Sphingomonadaceae bacterium]
MSDSGRWAALVPELSCSDLAASVSFYCDMLGFARRIERPGFTYISHGGAEIMLEAQEDGWATAALEKPYGRGINLQIEVDNAASLSARVTAAGIPLFRPLADRWYADGDREHGQREFLVQDPDGYLLRFAEPLGTRVV